MEFRTPEEALTEGIRRAAKSALGVEPEAIPLTYPPNPDLGDLATPVCFELARSLRKAPRDLAGAIIEAFEPVGDIERVELAGAGYINAFFNRTALLRRWLAAGPPEAGEVAADAPKMIVEHTNINPNKAAHIGHLRNAVLGDTLVRFLRQLGHPVEVQNYIDDTGVQVADLVVGFLKIRGEDLAAFEERYDEHKLREAGERFDYIAWDLYAQVTRYYEEDPERKAHRREVLQAMEHGGNPTAELAASVARRMVQHHLMTMDRIGVRYDLLPRESDILALRFWDKAFGLLKSTGAIHLENEGKHGGCWVMDMPDAKQGAGEDQKVIVRSDGTVTYVGKDIAYQMWKFGLLGKDFNYRRFDWSPQDELYPLWSTHSDDDTPERPTFGNGSRVYNVIDTRQSYLQRVVTLGLRSLGHDDQADQSIHYAYEMVALTPAAVAALIPDYPLTEEDRGRAYLEMAGRRGLGVRADDLLDALLERATAATRERNPEMPADDVHKTALQISVGAMRYYMLRFTRNRVVAFDLDATLAFEGETGPYLQYSVVRAKNILSKVAEQFGDCSADSKTLADIADLKDLDPETLGDHWGLALQLLRADAVIRQAVDTLELSLVAKHAYMLAQSFNSFYHRYKVLKEPDDSLRAIRVALVRMYHDGQIALLGLMGVSVPERM